MLVRDHEDGPQVFVLQRVSTMAFAAGMTVFPGGAVDPSDHAEAIVWQGPDPQWWAAALGTAPARAHALVVAAVRELFEESGVLLAGGVGARATEAHREALAAHRCGLSQVLRELDLPLRADLLRPWANWITPGRRIRRYDTFFFVAALPAGAVAESTTTEADGGRWVTPGELLTEFATGRVGLLPPTIAALTDLAEFDTVAAILDEPRQVVAIRPELIRGADGQSLVRAGGREYPPPAHDPAASGRAPVASGRAPAGPDEHKPDSR